MVALGRSSVAGQRWKQETTDKRWCGLDQGDCCEKWLSYWYFKIRVYRTGLYTGYGMRQSSQVSIQIVRPGWAEGWICICWDGAVFRKGEFGRQDQEPSFGVLSLICLLAIQGISLRRMHYFWKFAKTRNDILKDTLLGDLVVLRNPELPPKLLSGLNFCG